MRNASSKPPVTPMSASRRPSRFDRRPACRTRPTAGARRPPRTGKIPRWRAIPGAWRVTATLLFVAAAGCTRQDATAVAVVRTTLTAEGAPLARTLRIELDRAAPITVEYREEGGPRFAVASPAAREHMVYLARLHAGRTYHYQVVDPHASGTFTTDPLPPDLAALTFDVEGELSIPLAMVHAYDPTGFKGYVAIDGAGEVVWYWRTVDFPFGFARRPNGDFVFMDKGRGLVEVTPGGAEPYELPQDTAAREMHHDVIAQGDDALLFIAFDARDLDGSGLEGDAIWSWRPEAGTAERMWTSWDHLSPVADRGPLLGREWLHANALGIGPRGNVTISFHHLYQVASIAPDWRTFEWRLGGTGASVSVPQAERFSGQHAAREVRTGHVLIFDNGIARGGYSRAVELAFTADSAHVVWEWRPERDNFASAVGSARRLEDGATLVAFGMSAGLAGSTGPAEAYEVAPDGRVLWHLVVGGAQVMFRVEPLASIAGEVAAGG